MNIFPFGISKRRASGFMLLEVLLSIGLLALILSTLGSVVLVSGGTTRGGQSNKAALAAQEGLAALQTMSFADLSATETGTLSFAGNRWTLGSGAAQTISTGITRFVRVRAVNRDASCQIVSSGGTADIDSKTLQSIVNWIDLAGRSHNITLSALKTQWENPQGSCFMPTEAGCSNIDYLTSGQWFGGKQLRTVYFANTCSNAPIVIDKIIFTWNNGAEIQQVFIGSTKVWSSAGPGTPRGEQHSGVTLDISDFTLNPGVQYELNKTQFEHAMSGTTVTITLIFSDGTSFSTPPFVPTN
jgi:hypothetical protein